MTDLISSRRRVLAGVSGAFIVGTAGCLGDSDSNAEEPNNEPNDADEPTETEEPSVGLDSENVPPCDGEDAFIKIIELNDSGGGTEIVLENQLNTEVYIDFFEVGHGGVGESTLIRDDFSIPGRGVEARTVEVEPGEIDWVTISTSEPNKNDVECQ